MHGYPCSVRIQEWPEAWIDLGGHVSGDARFVASYKPCGARPHAGSGRASEHIEVRMCSARSLQQLPRNRCQASVAGSRRSFGAEPSVQRRSAAAFHTSGEFRTFRRPKARAAYSPHSMLRRRMLTAGSGRQIHLIAGIEIVGVDKRVAVQGQHSLWIFIIGFGDAPDRIA
jgi:hypothetical protein